MLLRRRWEAMRLVSGFSSVLLALVLFEGSRGSRRSENGACSFWPCWSWRREQFLFAFVGGAPVPGRMRNAGGVFVPAIDRISGVLCRQGLPCQCICMHGQELRLC